MSLIEEIKKLRELEQKATPKWILSNPLKGEYQIYSEFGDLNIEFEDSDIDDPRFIVVSRNLAPAMLSVLECFREGDAETLHLMKEILSHVKEDNIISIRLKHGQDISDYVDCLARSERAASLMEQEEREG